ncbi:uncharacterized protein [Medicago truncatula]|uniref:DUF247 domain protein n=1 Tax=Medicago truncatula TaxID=3880 RepID=G7IA42_MEDTR|nr:uncharacterized protein LOC11421187 [Medicago truncatula]AES59953.1 DUF247 domain protein [Medicago truncatula]
MAIIPYMQAVLESRLYEEVHPCSICRVPNKLRDLKEDAYTPKSIFIGLLPRGETNYRQVQLMVGIKWQYMNRFLLQENQQNVPGTFDTRLSACSEDIPIFEIDIRASYDGSILGSELTTDVIGRKMILDGCFLLQLLSRLEHPTIDPQDPIFETREKMCAAVNDITLLENQIPFIVLKKLYRKTIGERFVPEHDNPVDQHVEIRIDHRVDVEQIDNGAGVVNAPVAVKLINNGAEVVNPPVAQHVQVWNDHRVARIVQRAFGYPLQNTRGCAHILDLMHFSTVEDSRIRDAKPARQELVRCATSLLAAGIIIIPVPCLVERNPQVLDLTDTFDFNIRLDYITGELRIPVLNFKETTEVRWRNLIAWEQSKINIRCKYTSYALFFKGLICCESDIGLLQEKGVIVLDGCDRSRKDLMTLFSTISQGAEHMDSSFTDICTSLNNYMSMRFTMIILFRLMWHKCRIGYETSRNFIREGREMQSTRWKIVGVLAATALIILFRQSTNSFY